MPRPKTIEQAKRLCSGCRNDRYNYKGTCERPGIDAVVNSDKCWSLGLDRVLYCRAKKTFVLPCHSGLRQKWLSEYAQKGSRPQWNPY